MIVGEPQIHPGMEPVQQDLSQECVSVCSKVSEDEYYNCLAGVIVVGI